MGDHYIPQYYLRGFTVGNSIWAHDRKLRRSFQSQPKSVANETEMYPEELEAFLANCIENPALPAIDKIRLKLQLSSEERIAFARYVIYLWKRVPEGRNRVAKNVPSVAESLRTELHDKLDKAAGESPDLIHLANEKKDFVDKLLDKYKQNPPPHIWQDVLAKDIRPDLMNSLLSMHWRFLVTEHTPLLTCDNPVYFHTAEGIGNANSELTLPISNSIALWASRSVNHDSAYLPASKAATRELNRRTAYNATRFVYSSSNESWILPFVLKNRYLLARLQ